MRRLIFALALAAAGADRPSPAQAPPPRPAPVPKLVFNAQDYGAVPNDGKDDTAAIQRAVDAATAASRKPSGGAVADRTVVDLGSGWYATSYPIYVDSDNVTVRGDGAWVTAYGKCPAFALGVHRSDAGRVIDDSYRPGGAALATYGSNGPAAVKYVAGPLDLGRFIEVNPGQFVPDHYGQTDKLTVDLCVRAERKAGQFWAGVGRPGGQESPWAVWVPGDNPDVVVFAYKTEGQSRANESPFQARVSLAGLDRSQPINLSFQLDLSAGKVWAWINGRAVPVDDNGDRRQRGKRLLCNEGVNCFTIGAGLNGDVSSADQVCNITVFGFSAAASLKYRDVPVGGQQFRADVGKANDPGTWQAADQGYRVNPYNLPGLLDSLRPGEVRGDKRGVVFQNGWGAFRHSTVGAGRFAAGVRLQGLKLRTNGVGVLIGNTLTTRIEDVQAEGVRGVSSFSALSSYTIYLDHCNLSGSDTPLFARWMDVSVRDLEVQTGGVDSLRAADSSVSVDVMRVWFPGPRPRRIVSFLGGEYGGFLGLRKLIVDYEGNEVSDCGILLEQTANTPGTVDLDNLTFGTVGKVPLVRCHQWADDIGVYRPGTLTGRNWVSMGGDYSCAVQTDGPAWSGTVYAPGLGRGVVSVDPKGRPSNVVMTGGGK